MKRFVGLILCTAFVFSPALRADSSEGSSSEIAELVIDGEPTPPDPAPEDLSSEGAQFAEEEAVSSPEDAPKYVGQASQESVDAAKERAWVKYVAAAGAIAVAVVALILVSKNPGKRPKGS